MASFQYKAFDKTGRSLSGSVAAVSEKAAFDILSGRGLSPYELKLQQARRRGLGFARRRRIKTRDLSRYMRQMSTLVGAGVTLGDALDTLSRSASLPALAERTKLLKRELRAGNRLSYALERHFPDLPDFVVRLAELGEATGALAAALSDAADRMESEEALQSEIRSALTYPVFLATIGAAIVLLMFVFVVPRFDALIGDNRDAVPAISRAVIGFGVSLRENWPQIVALILGGVAGGWTLQRNKSVRGAMRAQAERLPVVGRFLIDGDVGNWCRTVGVALKNKAHLVAALELGESGCRSRSLRANLEILRREVRAGRPLDEVLAEVEQRIDPMVIDLIRTGRNAGALGEMLLFAAGIFEKSAKERSKQLTALMEPAAILLISLVVGTIVVSIVLAMTSLYDFAV